jgi:CheY-like chemotaxis protein
MTDPRSGGGLASDAATPPQGRRILVADDHRDSADSLAMVLQMQGHEVLTAYDGQSAVTLAESFHPEVMVIDVAMPRLDGFEVARCVRASAGGAGVLLVALSGWSDDEDRGKAEAAGFDRYWVKPVTKADLADLVRPGA